METPPAYAPPKKSNTGLIIGLVLGGIAICCVGGVAILGYMGLGFFNNTLRPIGECMMNYSFVEKALKEYEKEHDGKLPSAAKWQDELAPYITKYIAEAKGDAGPFKLMDPNGEWGCTTDKVKTGMAFNSEASGQSMEQARAKDMMIVFESPQTGRNLVLKYERLERATSPKMMGNPRGWITISGASGLTMDGKNVNSGSFDFDAKK